MGVAAAVLEGEGEAGQDGAEGGWEGEVAVAVAVAVEWLDD